MPAIIEAVHAYCTLGEISGTMRGVFGEYKALAAIWKPSFLGVRSSGRELALLGVRSLMLRDPGRQGGRRGMGHGVRIRADGIRGGARGGAVARSVKTGLVSPDAG